MRISKAFWQAAALALGAVLLFAGCRSASSANAASNNQPQIVDVTASQAVIRPIPSYFEATGNLVSDEQTDVAPAVAGKIAQVNFDVGSYVQKGDVLVRLDDRDARIRLEQAVSQQQQAEAAVGQADAQVEQAKANLDAA